MNRQSFKLEDVSGEFKHVLSHRVVHAYFIRITVSDPFEVSGDMRWVERNELQELGVSRLVDRYLQQLYGS
jgi:adenine-specific DNA glycosylase